MNLRPCPDGVSCEDTYIHIYILSFFIQMSFSLSHHSALALGTPSRLLAQNWILLAQQYNTRSQNEALQLFECPQSILYSIFIEHPQFIHMLAFLARDGRWRRLQQGHLPFSWHALQHVHQRIESLPALSQKVPHSLHGQIF